jgi:uncharacterized protein
MIAAAAVCSAIARQVYRPQRVGRGAVYLQENVITAAGFDWLHMRLPGMTNKDHQFIDVFELARTGQQVEGGRPLAGLPRLATMLAGPSLDLQFHYRGHLDAHRRSAGTLQIAAQVPLRCDRCGGTLVLPVAIHGSFYFVNAEAELARIPVDDSDNEPLLGSRRFDLDELIEDELILACPISPRHPDCESDAPPVERPGEVAAEPASEAEPEPRRAPFAARAGFKPRRH